MTENSENPEPENESDDQVEPQSEEAGQQVNISRLRQMAIRGTKYREELEIEDYYGLSGTLYVRPLSDIEFLPIAAFLEDRLHIDEEEAQQMLEDGKDEAGRIDPANFDEDFVAIMQKAAALGIDTTQGLAEGEDEEGVHEIVAMLQGGLSLVIAEKVLSVTSDAGKAESFRRDGGSK